MSFQLVSHSSYYKCPVTKGLIGCMFVISASLHAPSLSTLRSSIIYSFNDIVYRFNWWRLLTSKIAFLDVKDLVCCSLLFHFFRVFERRYGSRKYASYLLSNLVVSSLLEVGIVYSLRYFGDVSINVLPSGPIALVFSLFVKFFNEIPNNSNVLVFGIPITSKSLHYFLGLQLLNARSKFVSAAAGILSGLLFQFTSPFINVPQSIADVIYKIFSWIDSDPPEEGPILMGATLEIQREQQMEILEQEMMLNSFQELRNSQMSPASPGHFSSSPASSSTERVVENFASPSTSTSDSLNNGNVRNIFHLPPGYLQNSNGNLSNQPASPSPSTSSSVNSTHSTNNSVSALPSTSTSPSPVPSTSSSSNVDRIINSSTLVSENDIGTLVEMGFNRQAVIDALEKSNNDLTEATTLLLSDA